MSALVWANFETSEATLSFGKAGKWFSILINYCEAKKLFWQFSNKYSPMTFQADLTG